MAGRVEELPEAGDFLVWERIGQSILIARQADGSLAGFHNVCRHHAAAVATPTQITKLEPAISPSVARADLHGKHPAARPG